MRYSVPKPVLVWLVVALGGFLGVPLFGQARVAGPAPSPETWLAANLSRFHERFDVYSDASAAGNHFPVRGRLYCEPSRSGRGRTGRCQVMSTLPPELLGVFDTLAAETAEALRFELEAGTLDSELPGRYGVTAAQLESVRRRVRAERAERAVPTMDEEFYCDDRTHKPGTCIRASFHPQTKGDEWGGWYLMNGIFPAPSASTVPAVTATGRGAQPGENWGSTLDAGIDLAGATTLSFWAKADQEAVVDFFALGVGHDELGLTLPSGANASYLGADSDSRVPAAEGGTIKLSTKWQRYTIDLRHRHLNRVLGGFAWVASATKNRHKDVMFSLDDISYDLARPNEPRLPLSYEVDPRLPASSPFGFDSVTRNVAFTYDAAVAVIAFLSAGDLPRARLVADALIYAQCHDRYYDDGRLRNAYQAGDLFLPPGWKPDRPGWDDARRGNTVRAPGWYVPIETTSRDGNMRPIGWYEDRFHASTHSGNVAWAMLALLSVWEATDGRLTAAQRSPYLRSAVRLGEWLDRECQCKDLSDWRGGYMGGWDGWEPSPTTSARSVSTKLTYRATEHNIDLSAAFERLGRATGDARWAADAEHARRFVESMWDEKRGRYLTGTGPDSSEPNMNAIPVDVQAWAVLALGERAHVEALDYADRELRAGEGFAFAARRRGDAEVVDHTKIWYEGTAQMALAFRLSPRRSPQDRKRADEIVAALHRGRNADGAMYAASDDDLKTGFNSVGDEEWIYYRRPHTGATAWAVLAERGVNPFAPMEAH